MKDNNQIVQKTKAIEGGAEKGALLDVDNTIVLNDGLDWNYALLEQLIREGRNKIILTTAACHYTWSTVVKRLESGLNSEGYRYVTRLEVKQKLEDMGFEVMGVLVTASASYEQKDHKKFGAYFDEVFGKEEKEFLNPNNAAQVDKNDLMKSTKRLAYVQTPAFVEQASADRQKPSEELDSSKKKMLAHAVKHMHNHGIRDLKFYDDSHKICEHHQKETPTVKVMHVELDRRPSSLPAAQKLLPKNKEKQFAITVDKYSEQLLDCGKDPHQQSEVFKEIEQIGQRLYPQKNLIEQMPCNAPV